MPRKKAKTRAERGKVHVSSRGRMLYLRWTYQGQHYEKSMGLPDSPFNRNAAQGRAAEIERDIAREEFDPTLEKYWPTPEVEPEHLSTVDLWTKFMEFKQQSGTSGQAISSRYKPMLGNLKRFGRDILTPEDARELIALLASRQAPLTLNQNVSLLKTSFAEWAIEQGYWESNPFEGQRRVKEGRAKNPKRQPFTKDEVQRFLQAIKMDRYYSSYHDFCAALFFLGLRPSEAAGLRWKDIDFQRNIVQVRGSLSRNPDGRSAGYARQWKITKNGEERDLVMPTPIRQILEGRLQPGDKPGDLIFLTPKGNPIDDHSFSQRCWKSICKKIGVDRVPYAARHSTGSHMLEAGASPAQVAEALGNRIETTIRHYLHGVEKAALPTYGIEPDGGEG